MKILVEIFLLVYLLSVAICFFGSFSLKRSDGKFDFGNTVSVIFVGFCPVINVFIAFKFIKDYFDKPNQIIIFREELAKIRKFISSNQALSANDVFRTLSCPSNEHLGEYEKVKNEVATAMAKYAEVKRQIDEEEKRQREIRNQEIRIKQEEKERAERQRLAELAQSGQILNSLSPQEFELIILEAFSRQGFKTTHTSFSGDEGVDGFIEKGNTKIAIQCKKYNDSIGQPAIRDFYGAMMHFNCDEGIFVTTSDYSDPAKDFVKNKKIQLFNRQKTLNLLQSTLNNDYVVKGRTIQFISPEKQRDEELKEYIGPILNARFVLIPAGTFMMGSPEDDPDREDGETLHQVTISKPFYIQTTLVTQGQWKTVSAHPNPPNPNIYYHFEVRGNNPSYFRGDDNLPVESVSWNDIQEFIGKINKMEGTDKYRLPTEAQWEYACRAGSTTEYCFADDDDLGEYAWNWYNSGDKTHPVGQKKPNAWGLYDMHGNVAEWCQDWYDDYPSDSVTDPVGPSTGTDRVCRGGGWHDFARYGRAAYPPDHRYFGLGFRLIRTL
jgi:formylglycine-generating enzyme required for sulfatase activity